MWTPIKKKLLILFIAGIFIPAGLLAEEVQENPPIPVKDAEQKLILSELLPAALSNNPELKAMEQRVHQAEFRIPQARALPDPMIMFGYQNEGWDKYSYGEMPDSWWIYQASQTFPFPGKRGLKGKMAKEYALSLSADYEQQKLQTEARVKELYYDLFSFYKELEIIDARRTLFQRVEDAALARYTSGMGTQEEVLMAQTEKYMLLEKEEMQRAEIRTKEGMLNAALGRDVNSPLGRPEEVSPTMPVKSMENFLASYTTSPQIQAKERMIAGAQARIKMAKKEYYPDFTLAATVMPRGGSFEDMWSLTTQMNIPLYYKSKQRQAVYEAEAGLSQAREELESIKLTITSGIRENYAVLKSAESLMELYQKGIIPKIYQDFESGLAGYHTGRVEAITVINRLKALLDTESLYWKQVVQHEKALARLNALSGISSLESK